MLLIDRIFKKNLQAWEILDFSIVCTKNYKMGKNVISTTTKHRKAEKCFKDFLFLCFQSLYNLQGRLYQDLVGILWKIYRVV
jgi:hypothetical protein